MKSAWIMLCSGVALSATTSPPVEPESGYNVQLPAGSARVISIAVAGSPKFVPKEEPVIVEASFGTVRDKKLSDAFRATWVRARSSNGKSPCRALAVNVAADDSISRTGTYNVVLNLQPVSQPNAGRWHLQIVQPPAQLDVQPLSITRLRWTPAPFQEPLPKLILREGSGNTGLTLTEATQWDTTPARGQVRILGLKANESASYPRHASNIADIPAGDSSGELAYELIGFPPGKVSHVIRFLGPQLAAPATVNVDVETRWPWFYLWLAILSGLFASWYVKRI